MQLRPVTYRAELVQPLLTEVASGACCSVVGMSGVGKTNLLQHLVRSDVHQHHLGSRAERLRVTLLDANMLVDGSAWGFFEGFGEALLTNLGNELATELRAQLADRHAQVLSSEGEIGPALRFCSELLQVFCTQWQFVVLLDEFDPLFAQLPGQVLRNLRGLRDRFKYHLMFVTFSRAPLSSLPYTNEWDDVEPFIELFSHHQHGLRPLSEIDARAEIHRLVVRQGRALDAQVQQAIARWSGGHPALLRALIQAASRGAIDRHSHPSQILPQARLECVQIWNQLSNDEQAGLLAVARGTPLTPEQTAELSLKGLVKPTSRNELSCFSSVFADYIASIDHGQMSLSPDLLVVNAHLGTVHYYGRNITAELSPLEYQLLNHLWIHQGRVCPVEAVAEAVYGEHYGDVAPLRTLARRLRRRLEQLVPDQPVLLTILRMRGYRLGLPE